MIQRASLIDPGGIEFGGKAARNEPQIIPTQGDERHG